MFVWNKESSKVTVMHWVSRNETICFAKHGDLSNPAFKFEMHISLLVKRSFKLIELSIADGDELYKPLRIFHLDVLYPPKVKVLTVDGHEVRDVHLIDEDQKVTVVCSFDKGNPPTQFRLLDRRGKDLKSVNDADNISHAFAVKCEDDWPNVRCEGVGSKYNRSVSFLVTCPPHFVDSHKTISPGLREVALRVKAHSTAIGECYLTSGLSSSNVIQKTNCTLSGNPPDLVLNLYLGKENETTEGNWTLTFRNERGSANATIIIRNAPGSRGGNAQNETTNGNEGERTSKKSDSSTSSPGQAAGNGSKSGGSTPRSSSSGSDKPSTNPNYTSTALQEVEIHAYMDLHTRDPTYASTTSSKDPHTYMELKTLRAQSDPQQPGGERNGNDGYETPQMPGRGNQSSDGYETPQPPREGRRRSALYANQGISGEAIQEEVDYYNEA